MGLIKRAGDLVYTFRFLALLVTPFEKTKAFEKGIIDKDGKRLVKPPFSKIEDRNNYAEYYSPFIRLVFNIKKLMAKAPGGSSRIASYAAALYLIKENFSVSEKNLRKDLLKAGIDPSDLLAEESKWFMLEDNQLSPGVYSLKYEKVLNATCEPTVNAKDKVRIHDECFPVGDIFGLNIYEATHMRSQQKLYITAEELLR
tara:strand:- start:182 stop:781 length:600 start_codon:yes stop_codon:yes gene_type:complete